MLTKKLNRKFKEKVDGDYLVTDGRFLYYGPKVNLLAAREIFDSYYEYLLENHKREQIEKRLSKLLKGFPEGVTPVTIISYLLVNKTIIEVQEEVDKWFKDKQTNRLM